MRMIPQAENAEEKINLLQSALLDMPQYEPETEHFFHGGMYCRKVFRHSGVCIVGKVHKKEHLYIVLDGIVLISDGNKVEEFQAPSVFFSKPGTKRAVFAVTDAVCMTVHVTDCTTVEDAEKELVEDDEDSPFLVGNKLPVDLIAGDKK